MDIYCSYCGINDGLVVEVDSTPCVKFQNIYRKWVECIVGWRYEYLVQWEEFIENILTSGQEITLYKDYVELKRRN